MLVQSMTKRLVPYYFISSNGVRYTLRGGNVVLRRKSEIRKVFMMSKITEIYAQYTAGKKFKTVSELVEESLHIKNPSDLVGSNKTMQELAKKHSKYFK